LRRRLAGILVALVAAGCAQGPRVDGERPRVVFLGDSITAGWAQQPFIRDNADFVARGVSGETLAQIASRFDRDVVAVHPAVVHLLGGTNDVAENQGHEADAEIQGHIAAIVDLARKNRITIVLGSIPPAGDFHWRPGLRPAPRIVRLNAWIKDFAARNGLEYADYWSVLATPDGAMKPELAPDGVHPNAAGYAVMQAPARGAIERALERRSRQAAGARGK
jgi:lysophospholipase L1-like esterase